MQQKIHFTNSRGERLAGVVHHPDSGPVRGAALFAHCFTCTKNVLAAVHIAEALASEGILVLRFDFTGLGQSEGDFADTHFSANVQDLVDAAGYMAGEHRAPDILVGHSLGGTAVLAAAHEIDSAVAVATIGSPAEAEHVLHLLGDELETVESQGEAKVNLAGRPFHIRREFVEDVRSQSVRDGVRTLRRALLIMHSPIDELVSIEEAGRLYASALHPKSFVSLDRADHLLTRKEDSLYAGRMLAAWADRYLPQPDLAPPAQHVAGATRVEGRTQDAFRVQVNADGHGLLADEPAAVGGTNFGPTPYDLLAAALGTCTVMTINFFARREDLPLEEVVVEVVHDRLHVDDCESCETRSGHVDRLTRRIGLSGDLDQEQRDLCMKIADRCPVHKTLQSEIVIENETLD